jgi:hypothetical protein
MRGLKEITFETNGTQKLTPEFKEYLRKWNSVVGRELTFSVSAKLPASGEKWEKAICPEIVCEYEQVGTAYLKFVVATEADIADAECAGVTVIDFKCHCLKMNGVHDETICRKIIWH